MAVGGLQCSLACNVAQPLEDVLPLDVVAVELRHLRLEPGLREACSLHLVTLKAIQVEVVADGTFTHTGICNRTIHNRVPYLKKVVAKQILAWC